MNSPAASEFTIAPLMMQEASSSREACVTPSSWTIARPSAQTWALLSNVNRNSSLFLEAAAIEVNSEEHRKLKTTVQVLHRQRLHPFKYLEEQEPSRVEQLIAKAQLDLPWLNKYEDAWPARIYLKRFIDARRPHLRCTRYHQQKKIGKKKSQTSCKMPTTNLEGHNSVPGNHDLTVKGFLGSLAPSLEQHRDAFAELGIKDEKTLVAFLSWPQVIQAEFLDEGRGVLQLTSLEKKGLLLGCAQLLQKSLQKTLAALQV